MSQAEVFRHTDVVKPAGVQFLRLSSSPYEKRELESDQRITNITQVLHDSGLNKGKTDSQKLMAARFFKLFFQRIYELPIIVGSADLFDKSGSGVGRAFVAGKIGPATLQGHVQAFPVMIAVHFSIWPVRLAITFDQHRFGFHSPGLSSHLVPAPSRLRRRRQCADCSWQMSFQSFGIRKK